MRMLRPWLISLRSMGDTISSMVLSGPRDDIGIDLIMLGLTMGLIWSV